MRKRLWRPPRTKVMTFPSEHRGDGKRDHEDSVRQQPGLPARRHQGGVDVFDGQPLAQGEYEIRFDAVAGKLLTHLGVGNHLVLDASTLWPTSKRSRSGTRSSPSSKTCRTACTSPWRWRRAPARPTSTCGPSSSSTRRYGFQKFVIVVPSVAIREGVLKNIEITPRALPGASTTTCRSSTWSTTPSRLTACGSSPVSNTLQILIINIDASFNEEEQNNVIYKESDKLSGRKPIEFVQATRPIVIIDEPQSVEIDRAKARAITGAEPALHAALLRHAPQPLQPASTGSTRCGPST